MDVKCDSGFIATIRPGISNNELRELHKQEGLTKPHLKSGWEHAYQWFTFVNRLVHLKIV